MASWFRRDESDDDLHAEIESHLAIERAEQEASGRPADVADSSARKLFGNAARVHEDIREQSRWTGVERFLQDCRFGWRLLVRSPVWTIVVISSMALGIGLSTAIFSVVHAILLAPLPYAYPERIVALQVVTPKPIGERFNPSPALWSYWRKHLNNTIEDLALTRSVANYNLTGDGTPERLLGARSSFNLPRVLGVEPMLGRTFTEQEQAADAKVIVLSHRLWVRRFGGDASVIGRRVQLNGAAHEVIGVMPASFSWPDSTFELWAPLYVPPTAIGHGFDYGYPCTGRLRRGATIEQAQAELQIVMQALAREYPAAYSAGGELASGRVTTLSENQTAAIRPTLLVLSGAVLCLLAIGCLNLAVLLIARAGARAKEILVRVTLGASGSRLRRQLLAEALPLALLGAAAGIAVAFGILQALAPLLPPRLPRVDLIGLNGAVIAFSLACSILVVLLASLLPARMSAEPRLASSLQQNSRTVSGRSRVRDVLVACQVALAMLLLFGSALFGRSFAELMAVHPGFNAANVLTMHMATSRSKYPTDEQVADYYRRLVERIRAVPGVIDAGFVNRLPLSGTAQTGGVEFAGRHVGANGEAMSMTDWRSATPGYFTTLGIPLLAGRFLSDTDRADTPTVCVIDVELARKVFGTESPIGQRIRRSAGRGLPNDAPWSEIVGVVGHVLHDSLEKDVRPQVYWPQTQRAQDRAALVVRTNGSPIAYSEAVVAAIHSQNPDQPVFDIRSMQGWVARSMQTRTLTTTVVSVFGVASVVLACLGLYGVISYATGLRLREFGIRLALGATGSEVLRIVLAHASALARIDPPLLANSDPLNLI